LVKGEVTLRAVAGVLVVARLGGGFLASISFYSSMLPNDVPRESLSRSLVLGGISYSDYSVEQFALFNKVAVNLVTRDNYSECVELGHVLSPQYSNFDSRPSALDPSPCRDFSLVMNVGGLEVYADQVFYGRFWHGTAALTKLLLYVTDLSSIRGLLTVMILLLICALTVVAFRRDKFVGATLAVFFFLASDIPFQGMLLTHGVPTFVGLLFSLAAYLVPKSSTILYYCLASLAGVFYAFFAQLYTPLLFMLLLVIFRILRTNEGDLGDRFSTAVAGSIWWLLGYGVMMIARFFELIARLGIDATLSELSSSTASKFTWNPFDLFVAIYHHTIIGTGGSHLRVVGIGLLMASLGFVLGLASKRNALELKFSRKISLPIAWITVWYLVMLGHNGHGWVANLTLGTLTYGILALRWLTTPAYSSSK
jgi:hypothetical protein